MTPCLGVIPSEWGARCYLQDGHDGDCQACAACLGDPEAHGLHVCGREPYEMMKVWVPAIPVPYKGLRKRCVCGAAFWREQSYREHYVRAHGCHEENPETTVEMDVSAAVRLGYGLWILRRAQRAVTDAADAAALAILAARKQVRDHDQAASSGSRRATS